MQLSCSVSGAFLHPLQLSSLLLQPELVTHLPVSPQTLCVQTATTCTEQVWQGCFRANPDRVAFSLFCRLLIARESPDSAEVSEEVAAEFDARKFAILRTFLALRLEEGEFVARHHYLAFMEWVLCTAPEQPFVVKVLRLWEVLMEGDLPFAGYPISSSNLALKHHW
jgi:hypothetical protein